MAMNEQIKTGLLTEHFGYTPLTLLDDIINTVNEVVFQAINSIEKGLLEARPQDLGFDVPEPNPEALDNSDDSVFPEAARVEIESGIVQLESLLNATVDKNFDKLEIYTLRNLLTVSNVKEDQGLENWVMLDHYKNLPLAEPTDVTPDSLHTLRRKLQETEKLHAGLRAEQARNDVLLERLRTLVPTSPSQSAQALFAAPIKSEGRHEPSLSFLTATPSASTLGLSTKPQVESLAQNTQFALSQLPALKALLAHLRPRLASLPQSSLPGARNKSEEARQAYIGSQSRKAMERRGIDVSGNAAAEAGDLGRRMGTDEIRALEGIVKTLGSAGTRGAEEGDRMEE